MAAWIRDDVRAYASELAALADGVIDYWIAEAATEVDDRVFGTLTKKAGANLTAHLLVMSGAAKAVGINPPGANGGTGAVASVSVGSVAVTYAQHATTLGGSARSALMLTRWGVEYSRLVQLRAGGPWLADVGD